MRLIRILCVSWNYTFGSQYVCIYIENGPIDGLERNGNLSKVAPSHYKVAPLISMTQLSFFFFFFQSTTNRSIGKSYLAIHLATSHRRLANLFNHRPRLMTSTIPPNYWFTITFILPIFYPRIDQFPRSFWEMDTRNIDIDTVREESRNKLCGVFFLNAIYQAIRKRIKKQAAIRSFGFHERKWTKFDRIL